MSFEHLDTDKVPSRDMAAWLAKIHRVRFALAQQLIVTGEDGVCAVALADPNPEPSLKDHWTDTRNRAEAYESVMLYELAQNLSLEPFRKAVASPPLEYIDPLVFPSTDKSPSRNETNARAKALSNQALLAAFGRLGMIEIAEDNTRTAPDGLVAAFMCQRADIRQASDRRLFERASQITRLKRQIERATPPRTMLLEFHNGETQETSVYQGIVYSSELAAPVDAERPHLSATDRWWQELALDYERIEQAALHQVAA